MTKLRDFLNSIPVREQESFSIRCGTTIGYLRNAICTKRRIGESIAISIDRETNGVVKAEEIRPDCAEVFAYLRSTGRKARK